MSKEKQDKSQGGLGALIIIIGLALAGSHPHAVTSAAGKAASLVSTPVPATVAANVALGERMAAARGWTGGQWLCLRALWNRESGWDALATYPSTTTPPSAPSSSITTAYGIPQSLPAQKMATAGPDWRTNPATQIRWGLGDIADVYGTPCAAWAHELAKGWY